MALYARLIGSGEPKLPVHQFVAGLSEVQRGKITLAQFKNGFALTTAERNELDELLPQLTGLTSKEIEDVLELAEHGLFYVTAGDIRTRFGLSPS